MAHSEKLYHIQKIDELEVARDRAAAGNNKPLIIAMVNKTYVEEVEGGSTMLDLFLESFWEGEGTLPLLDHLMVGAADRRAYDCCHFRRLHCLKMETKGVDLEGEKVFKSKDFIEMMWRSTEKRKVPQSNLQSWWITQLSELGTFLVPKARIIHTNRPNALLVM